MGVPKNIPPGFEVEGCQALFGKECRGCGGWYKAQTTEVLTKATLNGTINRHNLCGPLADRVKYAQVLLESFYRQGQQKNPLIMLICRFVPGLHGTVRSIAAKK
jgi:hypothetical protein